MKKLFKPRRLALAVAALTLPLGALANQSLTTAGYTATTGGVVNEGSVHSSSFNPAGNNLLLKHNENLRFGYLSNLGVYAELGESENLDIKIDSMVDQMDWLDELDNPLSNGKWELGELYGHGEDDSFYYEAVAKNANGLLVDLEKGGQIRAGGLVQVPLTPFLMRSNAAKGTFSLNASASLQVKGAFLGGPFGVQSTIKANGKDYNLNLDLEKAAGAYKNLKDKIDDINVNLNGDLNKNNINDIKGILYNAGLLSGGNSEAIEELLADVGNGNVDFDNKTSLTTNSGLDVRAALVKHISLGYGTNLSEMFELNRDYGQLEAGARLNVYNVEAGRKFISLQAEANDNSGNSTSDNLTEDFLDNTKTSTGIGLDLGFLWHAANYQAGITFYNINEPSFDYPDMGKILANDAVTKGALEGLAAAGKASLKDEVTLTRHAVIEGAYFSKSRNWMLQGAYTLGTATDFVGDEHQNLSVAAGYYPKTVWIPGLRAGYSKNMKGTELSKVHAGATFFGVMHLDLAMATSNSSFDDTSIPRYFAVSLGFEEKF